MINISVNKYHKHGIDNFKQIYNFNYMKKLIDIPDEIVKPLKIMAVNNDRDLKNYIQDILISHVKKSN